MPLSHQRDKELRNPDKIKHQSNHSFKAKEL